eukprot:9050967-Alexandrium_andersonii.AAC.1
MVYLQAGALTISASVCPPRGPQTVRPGVPGLAQPGHGAWAKRRRRTDERRRDAPTDQTRIYPDAKSLSLIHI